MAKPLTAWDIARALDRLEALDEDDYCEWTERVKRMSMVERLDRGDRIQRAMWRLIERLRKITVNHGAKRAMWLERGKSNGFFYLTVCDPGKASQRHILIDPDQSPVELEPGEGPVKVRLVMD